MIVKNSSIKKRNVSDLVKVFRSATWPVYCQFLKCNPCINHVFNILKPLTLVPLCPPHTSLLLLLLFLTLRTCSAPLVAACLRLFSMPFHYRLLMYVLSFVHICLPFLPLRSLFSCSLFVSFLIGTYARA